jgi:molybdopterin-biosynthesis enzyme MoeA-like protein
VLGLYRLNIAAQLDGYISSQGCPITFGLIVVGDEILSGKRADQHVPKVIALLAARGMALAWARYVGDEPARLTADLRDAFTAAKQHGEIVMCCGGIGATPDDHTRACAAQALGVELHMNLEAQGFIDELAREKLHEAGKVFDADHPEHQSRRQMAMFPAGAQLIPNPYNRVAGFCMTFKSIAGPPQDDLTPSGGLAQRDRFGGSVHHSGGGVFFVPGFPVMAWPMIEGVLDGFCKDRHHTAALLEKSVIVQGAAESKIVPLLQTIEATFTGIKIFSLPSMAHPEWGVHMEVGLKGADLQQLDSAFAHLLAGLAAQGLKVLHGAEHHNPTP